MTGLKIGSKVKIKHDTVGSPAIGREGVIVNIVAGSIYPIHVKFDFSLGDYSHNIKSRHGESNMDVRRFSTQEIELVAKNNSAKVDSMKVIQNGNAVIVIVGEEGKKGYKKAVAKCSPEDQFDFFKGLAIALARIYDRPLPLFNGAELDKVEIRGDVYGDVARQSVTLINGETKLTFPIKVEA